METPFPGMDPYPEHPFLWPSVRLRLIVALANQLGPQIRPRHVASVEARIFIEEPGQPLEIHEPYIEILDRHRDFGVVTIIELVGPSNKAVGPSRDSYPTKQRQIRRSERHLVEIDLLRRGIHIMSVPVSDLVPAKPYDDPICVNRWPARSRFEFYPCRLHDPSRRLAFRWRSPIPAHP